MERLRKLSNLKAFVDKTFDNYDVPEHYPYKQYESVDHALKTALHFAQEMDGWLLLQGVYGTGKTHLAAAIGNQRLQQGDMVIFITVPDLLDYLRGGYSPSADMTYDELFERVKDATLLILDDLGVENPSEWAKEKLFQLLNYRYSHKKSTVITTNTPLETLDPRISSRLMDTQVVARVTIEAPDYRDASPHGAERFLTERLSMYAHMTFDNFDIRTMVTPDERDNLLKAAQAAEEYAHQPNRWILFMGGYGTGKTHLAAAIANQRHLMGDDVLFLTVPDLFDYLKTTFRADSQVSFSKLFGRIRDVPLLVLDDLGTDGKSAWSQEKLFQLLDYRYVAQKATVITTAKPFDDLNDRLVSRLIDARVCRNIALTVPSYAQRLKRR